MPSETSEQQPNLKQSVSNQHADSNLEASPDREDQLPIQQGSSPLSISSEQASPNQIQSSREEPSPEDLKFYMLQIYKIVAPVICCILLSVLWVKISLMGSDFRPSSPSVTVYEEKSSDSAGDIFLGSLSNALVFIGTIIGATVLFVLLFKYGCHKVSILFNQGYDFILDPLRLSFPNRCGSSWIHGLSSYIEYFTSI
jgi:presenilin 1